MSYQLRMIDLIQKYNYFIFDFDGVVKESVELKSKAYCELFSKYESAIPFIKNHHLENGGVSRYTKIPLYLSFCKLDQSPELVENYLIKFSNLVKKLVINSDWVPGILEFLNRIQDKKKIYIVSATPEKEMRKIIKNISLDIPFLNIYGSPNSKIKNIKKFVKKEFKKEYIFFGDSLSDASAAYEYKIDFAYRIYPLNFGIMPEFYTYTFSDFSSEIN